MRPCASVALNGGAFFQAHPDTPAKLADFAFAFEHLEQEPGAAERLGSSFVIAPTAAPASQGGH